MHFSACLKLQPDNAISEGRLGYALAMGGNLPAGILHLEKSVEMQPKYSEGHFNLANIYLNQRRLPDAIRHFELGLASEPGQMYPLLTLAHLLATSPDASIRNGARAVELSERANRLTGGGNAQVLATLAAAYAEAGRYDDATAAMERALEGSRSEPASASTLKQQLELYRNHQPLRDLTLTNAVGATTR